jgi:hypothetical protein
VAQYATPTSSKSTLNDAVALLNAGDPQSATNLINSIGTNDPTYTTAQCYKALCLYALHDKKGFLKTLDSQTVQSTLMSLDICEEVWFKQLDAFLGYGKFDSLSRKADAFQTTFPSSPRIQAVREYGLANALDRGVKKFRDGSRSKDPRDRSAQWSVAQTNLQQFLARATTWETTNYIALPNRVLREDVWVAQLLSGAGDAALAQIPTNDVASREKFCLLRLELNTDMQRDEIDENLQRLASFQRQFPNPINVARGSKTAAALNFRKGRQLSLQADDAELAGDLSAAAAAHSSATQYFVIQRSLQRSVTVDTNAGITEGDVLEMREDVLYSYFLEKNYAQLSSLLAATIAASTPGDLNWILAKVYLGISLASQVPPQTAAAEAALDEVLALGFNEEHHHDRLLVNAAKWRVNLLLREGNSVQADALIKSVNNSLCRRDYRVAFSNEYFNLLSIH